MAKIENPIMVVSGGENLLVYATRFPEVFRQAQLPEKIVLDTPLVTSFQMAFYLATGVKDITINLSSVTSLYSAFERCNSVEKITIIGQTNRVLEWRNTFYSTSLKTIDGEIDYSACNNYYVSCFEAALLENVSFVKNTIYYPIKFVVSTNLTNDSIISIANGLNETVTGKTLTLHATPKAKCNTIMGTVSLDETQTYHIFTADSAGTTTLANFITQTKGWTLA